MTSMLLLAAFLTLPAAAQESAEELYRQGKAAESAALLKARVDEEDKGGNASVASLYNLGTALAKAGTNAEAYAYLLRAYYRQPLDSDIRANLDFVAKKLPASAFSARPASWIAWWPDSFRVVPVALWLLLASLALMPALIQFALGSVSPSRFAWLALFVTLLFGSTLAAWQARYPSGALLRQTKLRSGPELSFEEISTLEGGSLVSLEETRDGWHKVRLQNANSQEAVGWVESSAVLRVLP